MADLRGYASALDLSVTIMLTKKEGTLVDRLKFHAGSIKRLMERLARLAREDEKIRDGALSFCGEAAFNLLKIVLDAAKVIQNAANRTPGRAPDRAPAFAIEVEDDSKDQEEIRDPLLVERKKQFNQPL